MGRGDRPVLPPVGQDQRAGALPAGLRSRQPHPTQRGHASQRKQFCGNYVFRFNLQFAVIMFLDLIYNLIFIFLDGVYNLCFFSCEPLKANVILSFFFNV